MIINYIKFIIFIYLLFCIYSYFFCLIKKILAQEVLLRSNFLKITSFLITFFFIFWFILFFRVFRLFSHRNNLDLKFYFNFYFFELNFSLFDKILLIILILVLLYQIKKYLVLLIKLNYLRTHYYFFLKVSIFRKLLFFIKNFEYFIFKLFNENKGYFSFFFLTFKYFFRLFFFFFLLKNIIFDDMQIYLGLLPYYGFYYFLVSIFFFFRLMEFDFEIGSLQYYYPQYCCITGLGLRKLYFYHMKLMTGTSKYMFVSSIIYDYRYLNQIPNNWIFFCYKNTSMYFKY